MKRILKYYRERLFLEQKDIAKQLNITPQRYFAIEKTDSVPEKYIGKLAELFKIRKNILEKSLANKNKTITADELRYYRQKKGVTKPELATLLNIYHTYIYNWEEGKFTPNEKNAATLMQYLEIPNYIIFPDVIECSDKHIIVEFENYVLIVAKEPFNYDISIPLKKTINAYLCSDFICNIRQPEKGERLLYPIDLNEGDTESFLLEFENQILIVTTNLLTPEQMNSIKLATNKNVIYASMDNMLMLISRLTGKKDKYFFFDELKSELESIFSTVIIDTTTKKFISSIERYVCNINYEQVSNEIILVKDVNITF